LLRVFDNLHPSDSDPKANYVVEWRIFPVLPRRHRIGESGGTNGNREASLAGQTGPEKVNSRRIALIFPTFSKALDQSSPAYLFYFAYYVLSDVPNKYSCVFQGVQEDMWTPNRYYPDPESATRLLSCRLIGIETMKSALKRKMQSKRLRIFVRIVFQ
jgi:hypothetical protein